MDYSFINSFTSKSEKKTSAKDSSSEKTHVKTGQVNIELDVLSYTYGNSTNISKVKEIAITFCLKELGMM